MGGGVADGFGAEAEGVAEDGELGGAEEPEGAGAVELALEFLEVVFEGWGGLKVDPSLLDDGAEEAAGGEGLSGVEGADRRGGVGGAEGLVAPVVVASGAAEAVAEGGGTWRGWR
jgi:hypothetical protein